MSKQPVVNVMVDTKLILHKIRVNCPYYVYSFFILYTWVVSIVELCYDQEIPQSYTAGGPMTP